jgi:ATP-dependent RNA helicase HelY
MARSPKNNARRRTKNGKKGSGNSESRPVDHFVNRRKERRHKSELAQTGPKDGLGVRAAAPVAGESQKRALDRLLSGIGTPDLAPFKPDEFQLEALEAIETEDVLVTAPTGSGKTWIAREEIRRLLAAGKKAWYTTPLKALTNSKYVEFQAEFGEENVGILTGDRKEKADAPLIVGTTEIYRNQLFDALRTGEDVKTDFVILDEAHYLADEDRGHVWEEAIILTPPRIRLLLLSATIGNAGEFAGWISEIRGINVRVVARPGARPVELRAAYLSTDLQLMPLLGEDGKLNPEVERLTKEEKMQRRSRFYNPRR